MFSYMFRIVVEAVAAFDGLVLESVLLSESIYI